jgi:hypothetical protein
MSITAANAVIQISVDVVFPTPHQLQGFATDDIYDAPTIKPTEVAMGVDGFQSSGFVFVSIPVTYDLQANSPSNRFFDDWYNAMQAAGETFVANGLILLSGVGSKWTMTNGSLTGYTPLPPAKKMLGPRKFEITWNKLFPAAA